MLSATGFSLITFAALLAGILSHTLKQFRTASVNGVKPTFTSYFANHWAETAIAVLSSIVLWAGLPEVGEQFPGIADLIKYEGEVGILSSFICGFVGNSLADMVGGRSRSITTRE